MVEVAAFMTIALLTQFAVDLDQLPNVAISSTWTSETAVLIELAGVYPISTTSFSELETVYVPHRPSSAVCVLVCVIFSPVAHSTFSAF